MKITVALTPSLLTEPRAQVVAVVDVLRATSSIVTMLENGLLRAIISDNLRQARRLALANFSLLCGEINALPPAGFDYGNSPSEFAALSFKGKSAVLFTTNGTRALAIAAEAPFVIAASLLNRRAAAERVVREAAARGLDIAIVCAGTERGMAFSLEDTAAAGAIIEAAQEADAGLTMTDASWAALHLWHWFKRDGMRVFRQSAHGRALHAIGLERDLAFAAQLDIYDSVPQMYFDGDTVVLRTRAPRRRR